MFEKLKQVFKKNKRVSFAKSDTSPVFEVGAYYKKSDSEHSYVFKILEPIRNDGQIRVAMAKRSRFNIHSIECTFLPYAVVDVCEHSTQKEFEELFGIWEDFIQLK